MESDVNYIDNSRCGATPCLSISNKDKYLECKTCKKKFHHCCTKLPTYQIGLFMLAETNANNSFLCEQCANVPEDLIQTCSEDITETSNTVVILKQQLEKKDDLDATQPKPHGQTNPVIGYRPKGVAIADFMPIEIKIRFAPFRRRP